MSSQYLRIFQQPRSAILLILGFASGLPLALTSGTLQAWMTVENIDLKTIGFFSLVGQAYVFKFLWSPLMDRYTPPFFGRRRGWLLATQILLLVAIAAMGFLEPGTQLRWMAALAVVIAFCSASQDIVFDAWKTDVLPAEERGAGAAISVLGYRLGMLVSGGLALWLADKWLGWQGDICAYANAGFTAERAGQLSRLTGTHVPAGTGTEAASLRDSLCLLQKSYRFGSDSGIGQLAAAINRGDKTAVKTVFQQDFTDIEKRLLQSGEDYIAMLEEALAGYGRYLDLLQARAEPDLIIQAFNEYQLLCALREGPFGVAGLNERIEQFMQQKRKIHRHPHSRWYEGRPVMIARNDSALGLFNGDIGIALDRGQGTRVWFAMPDGNIKSVQPSRLPEHETTWAMTVHKSQGSEFDHAALILPSQRTPVVTRELVYTAVTRARRRLSLYADERILSAAIATRTERRSGLAALFSSRE